MAKKVINMNGAAIKKGKFNGKEFRLKKGIMKDRFPIITCKNLREYLPEEPKSLVTFPETTITTKT